MAFLNALASYGLLLLIFVAVGGVAIFLGITLRKRKEANLAADTTEKES